MFTIFEASCILLCNFFETSSIPMYRNKCIQVCWWKTLCACVVVYQHKPVWYHAGNQNPDYKYQNHEITKNHEKIMKIMKNYEKIMKIHEKIIKKTCWVLVNIELVYRNLYDYIAYPSDIRLNELFIQLKTTFPGRKSKFWKFDVSMNFFLDIVTLTRGPHRIWISALVG